MRILTLSLFFLALSLFSLAPQAFAAQETNFVITVKAKDAKFIGTSVGGAHVIVRSKMTGDIIAEGITYGDTGDTKTVMAQSQPRDAVLVSEETAQFQFSLDFQEPVPVTISAAAPLGQRQSLASVSQDMILLPGKDYTSGNGIMLELPGFSIDITSPMPGQVFDFNSGIELTLEANVMKMCGCHVAEGTPWPPERYTVEAHIYKDGLYITSVTIPYAGEPGIFSSNIKIPLPGIYSIHLTAFDARTKESGMDTVSVTIREKPAPQDKKKG